MTAEQYIALGYQKILTFERPGGGFDWWGTDSPLVWLTAYGVQQLTATAKVHSIDTGVVDRACQFLCKNQSEEGTWDVAGKTHGERISYLPNAKLALTAYVAWSLAEAQREPAAVEKALSYLRKNRHQARGDCYILSIMANAFAFGKSDDPLLADILNELHSLKKESQNLVWWEYSGQTATCASGSSADIETTAMVLYAMIQARYSATVMRNAFQYLIAKRAPGGTWGSTQSTILSLKALVASAQIKKQDKPVTVDILFNERQAGQWFIDESNSDVMQVLDLGSQTQIGSNTIKLKMNVPSTMLYQIVGRYYEPWKATSAQERPIDINIEYDRKLLSKKDTIMATATMRYNGNKPTFMVILDLGIPPGFQVDESDFIELLGEKKINRYSLTSRQITLYLAEVKPNQVFQCTYQLKAKYPLRIKTPKSVAYEYYSPNIRAESQPMEIVVQKD